MNTYKIILKAKYNNNSNKKIKYYEDIETLINPLYPIKYLANRLRITNKIISIKRFFTLILKVKILKRNP